MHTSACRNRKKKNNCTKFSMVSHAVTHDDIQRAAESPSSCRQRVQLCSNIMNGSLHVDWAEAEGDELRHGFGRKWEDGQASLVVQQSQLCQLFQHLAWCQPLHTAAGHVQLAQLCTGFQAYTAELHPISQTGRDDCTDGSFRKLSRNSTHVSGIGSHACGALRSCPSAA